MYSDKCRQRILSTNLVEAYILELEEVLPISLFDLAVHLLLAQTNSKWLEEDVKHREIELAESHLQVSGLHIVLSKLQLLLLNKLEDEQERNSYLGSTAEQERNDAYTETDRAVRSLLDVKLEAGESQVQCY